MQELSNGVKIISVFVFIYPIFMSFFWIIGAILHHFLIERKYKSKKIEKEEPFIILVPVFNEADEIYQNIQNLLKVDYNNYQIWVIDDMSTDNSFSEIQKINSDKITIYQNEINLGKAATLNKYIEMIKTKHFIVIDSDTRIQADALQLINEQIYLDQNDYKVAGYTGNITVHYEGDEYRKLYFLQKIEYRMLIDMIKRSQYFFTNSIMTLSGAFSVYNTQAVKDVGMFNVENATEDINISWLFNQSGYNIKYVTGVKIAVACPGNTFDVINQRSRWTTGLYQTLFANMSSFFSFKNNKLKLYGIEMLLSSIWSFVFLFVTGYYILNIITKVIENIRLLDFLYSSIIILIASISLSLISYYISQNDNENIKLYLKYYFYLPFIFFLIQPLGFVKGFINVFKNKEHGKWRGKNSEKNRYYFAIITDSIITIVLTRVIFEVFEDIHTLIDPIYLKGIIIGYVVALIIFIYVYFNKFKVGNKLVGRKYKTTENSAFYLNLINVSMLILGIFLLVFDLIDYTIFNSYPIYLLLFYVLTFWFITKVLSTYKIKLN